MYLGYQSQIDDWNFIDYYDNDLIVSIIILPDCWILFVKGLIWSQKS